MDVSLVSQRKNLKNTRHFVVKIKPNWLRNDSTYIYFPWSMNYLWMKRKIKCNLFALADMLKSCLKNMYSSGNIHSPCFYCGSTYSRQLRMSAATELTCSCPFLLHCTVESANRCTQAQTHTHTHRQKLWICLYITASKTHPKSTFLKLSLSDVTCVITTDEICETNVTYRHVWIWIVVISQLTWWWWCYSITITTIRSKDIK